MKHRLFIALDVPDTLRRDITRLQTKLEKLSPYVTWEEPEKLHITLNFLGRIEERQIPQLENLIRRVSTLFRPFSLTPAFLETMYKRHEASFVYLGLAGDTGQLKQLNHDLSAALNRMAIPQPSRFLGHITIGRVKKSDPITVKSTLDNINQIGFSPLPPFTVESISLYESFLSRAGSHYSLVRHFVLK